MVTDGHFLKLPAATSVRSPVGTRGQSPWSGELPPTPCPWGDPGERWPGAREPEGDLLLSKSSGMIPNYFSE